jgi:homoserine dehydrogenase
MNNKEIGIGLLGLGTIAGQVVKVLQDRTQELAEKTGISLVLRKIKVLPADMTRPQAVSMPAGLLTTDEDKFWNTSGMDIIVELIGGEHPALDYQQKALASGRHVVTANKEVIAKHGVELLGIAASKKVFLRYEAAVGGGIPLIAPFERDLAANRINRISAIINGTTNYILSRMSQENIDFKEALSQAQALGYAEANPKNDIEGVDAAYKLAILASLAFQSEVKPDQVFHEGISRLTSTDFRYANELGYAIKLLAIAKRSGEQIEARVHPVFIPLDSFLAKINGVFNAVMVDGDLTGEVAFTGRGAGPLPTSSAVVADLLMIAKDISATGEARSQPECINLKRRVLSMDDITTKYYIRMSISDQAGVLAQIASVLGKHDISIASAIQKQSDKSNKVAEIVIMTHPARERAVQQAFNEFNDLTVVKEISNFVRVGD